MNRLHHIKQTLPQNIINNKEYNNANFVVLDYNSGDGLQSWIDENMHEYIDSGKLIYYHTTAPQYFDRSHSRNLLFRLCDGDIICNVDADNYIGKGFANYINQVFSESKDVFIMSDYKGVYEEYKDAYGRFCSKREDFLQIGGYDEVIKGYGFEDTDLYDRLERLGKNQITITDFNFLKSISHSNKERISNEFFIKNLYAFYVCYGHGKSFVLFLYNNKSFESGTLIPTKEYKGTYAIIEGGMWKKGIWDIVNDKLLLEFDNYEQDVLTTNNSGISYTLNNADSKITYYKIINKNYINNVINEYSLVTNVSRLDYNCEKNRITVNEGKFGRGVVYKNFDYTTSIEL